MKLAQNKLNINRNHLIYNHLVGHPHEPHQGILFAIDIGVWLKCKKGRDIRGQLAFGIV